MAVGEALRDLLERVSYAYPPGYEVVRDEHGLPVVDDPELDDDEPADGPGDDAVTAAGRDHSGRYATAERTRTWRLDRRTGNRLVDIDRDLTARVLALAEGSVGRAVEKAASRIRSDATKTTRSQTYRDPDVAAVFPKGADARAAVAASGQWVARLSDTAQLDQLIATAIDELEGPFLAECERAARAADDTLAGLTPAVTAAATRSRLVERVTANTRAAWRWLAARLRDHAREVLFGGHTPSRDGEADLGVVPTALIRAALAQAGGLSEGSAGIRDDGTSAEAFGGVATGDVALSALRVSGGVVIAREWQYPPAPRDHFPAHRALDGTVFEAWDDPALKTRPGDEWIGTHYRPSDHGGCLCFTAPVVIVPMTEDADPDGDEVAQLRQGVMGR